FYRQFPWRRLYPMLIETAALSGAILLIIGAATGMAWALTQSGFLALLATFMTGLGDGKDSFHQFTYGRGGGPAAVPGARPGDRSAMAPESGQSRGCSYRNG